MKLRLYPVLFAVLVFSRPASAQSPADASGPSDMAAPMFALGLVVSKNTCTRLYAHMRSDFDAAFESFVRRNTRLFNADRWHEFDASAPSRGPRELSEADCKTLLHDLPTLDGDGFVEKERKQLACWREADTLGQRLGNRRPWVGLFLNERLRTTEVERVAADSPAARAGVRPGDVIRVVGTSVIETPCDLSRAVMKLPLGADATFAIARGAELLSIGISPIAFVERVPEAPPPGARK